MKTTIDHGSTATLIIPITRFRLENTNKSYKNNHLYLVILEIVGFSHLFHKQETIFMLSILILNKNQYRKTLLCTYVEY